jgi:NAD(P)-dependent dehydrogenase (short-subunit alcohol dehydrogenase family)
MSRGKVALVTGASSGFGRLTARLLATKGFRVFGTSRKRLPDEAGVEMVELDVTVPESVASCVDAVLSRAAGLDVLVNNAGVTHASPVEETTIDAAMQVFDTTFWGTVRVTSAVLPHMRLRRSGLIVNVGSLAGLVGAPGQGFYSAGKHALEGYTETLAAEVHRFNIRLVLIEPGFFRTNIHLGMVKGTHRIAEYDAVRVGLESALLASLEGGGDPADVAARIASVAESASPKLRYRVGRDARWIPRLRALLPDAVYMREVRRRFRLDA